MGHQIASSTVTELHELRVVLQEPILVRPEEIIGADLGNLYLSPLDRQAPLFMYTLHAYSGNANNVIAARLVLMNALQKVLVLYYPAAGRIMRNEETGHQEIACNGEGVMFVEANVDLELKDLGDLRLVNPELEKKFVYQLRPTSDNPLLVVQITSFSCGGFILGFGWRHELFDGFSVAQFLTAWADLSRGTPLSDISPPNHNRRLLQPAQHSAVDTLVFEEIIKERFFGIPILREADLNKNRNNWESTLTDYSSSGFLPKYVTKMFTIPEEMVASLKKKAMDGELSTCSTFDVITAHAWLSRVKAMEINPSERILLEFAVNGRPKTIPPLPENFIGNAFIMASHNCTAGDILNSSFHDIVSRVQLAKATITDAYIRTNISTLEGMTNTKALPSFRETSIITDWTKFPYDLADFGWGRALFLTPVAMPLPDVIFVIRSGTQSSGITVRLGLRPSYMEKFEQFFLDIPSI